MHYKLRDLVATRVTRYTKPADGKPAYGFADRIQPGRGDGRQRQQSVFFGDRSQSESLELGFLRIHVGEQTPKRGDEIIGVVEPSRRSGGRAKWVYNWWCGWGKQVAELSRVVLKGTALTAQALRRRLRMGTNDSLWFLERIILHNDLRLAEILVQLERGYDPEFESEKEKLIASSVSFDGKAGAFVLMEHLAQEIDIELADFVAEMDGKYPVKMGQADAADLGALQHEDAVMPMDPTALMETAATPQNDFVGFSQVRAGQWGGRAAGWEAQETYDPMAESSRMQPRTPTGPTAQAGAITPPGGQTPEYYPPTGGQTPDYDEPLSPRSPGTSPGAAGGGGGSTTPPYMSPVSPE